MSQTSASNNVYNKTVRYVVGKLCIFKTVLFIAQYLVICQLVISIYSAMMVVWVEDPA